MLLEIPGYVFIAGVSQFQGNLRYGKICLAEQANYLLGASVLDLSVDGPVEGFLKTQFEITTRHGDIIDYIVNLNGFFDLQGFTHNYRQ